MIKSLISAGLLAGMFVFAGAATSAHAVTLPNADAVRGGGAEGIVLVRGGRGGGGHHGGHHGGGGGGHFSGHHGGHHGGRHHGGRGFIYYGVPSYYGYSNYYAGDRCAWLYRKAKRTGSRHWWHRYQDCRDN